MTIFIIIGLIIFIIFQSKKIKEQKKENQKDKYTLAMERYKASLDYSDFENEREKNNVDKKTNVTKKGKNKKVVEATQKGKMSNGKKILIILGIIVVWGFYMSAQEQAKLDRDVQAIKDSYVERTKTESYQIIKESTGKFPFEDTQDQFLCEELMSYEYGYTQSTCKKLGISQEDIDNAKERTPRYAKEKYEE